MALYDSIIRRSFDPTDPRWPYYWEVVADPSDNPMVLAGWAATPLEAADNVRHAMTVVSPQGPPRAYDMPEWPDGNFPTLKPADEPADAAILATDDNLIATIAARRNDTAFMERLNKSIAAHRTILDRLAGRVEFGNHTPRGSAAGDS